MGLVKCGLTLGAGFVKALLVLCGLTIKGGGELVLLRVCPLQLLLQITDALALLGKHAGGCGCLGTGLGKLGGQRLDLLLLVHKLRPKLLGVGLVAADRRFRCGKGGLGLNQTTWRWASARSWASCSWASWAAVIQIA